MKVKWFVVFALSLISLILAFQDVSFASEQAVIHHDYSWTFLWIALLLALGKVGSLVEKWGQPAVLGEILIGILLGNIGLFGVSAFESIKNDQFVVFLAEFGVVVLLFQIGLESNIERMRKVGTRAFLVACVGVVCPALLGIYIVGPLLLPGLNGITYLFLGAALTATSVSIPARMFKETGNLQTTEAQIVLGAAVIDDVLGLIILAVIMAIAQTGTVGAGSIVYIALQAFLFLAGAVYVGQRIAPLVSSWFSKIHTGTGMKFTIVMCFGLLFAAISGRIQLAPIVGAFAAGLMLDPSHFRHFRRPEFVHDVAEATSHLGSQDRKRIESILEHHSHRHIEELIVPVGHMLVPLFFVHTGMKTDLTAFFDGKILLVTLGITIAAVIGKYVSGFVAGPVSKSIVGFGMVPRGEVGLIFASAGLATGAITPEMFSIVVGMVVVTTLITPCVLAVLLKCKEIKVRGVPAP
jgi:Kef-type K+ transport system membrane component KefB